MTSPLSCGIVGAGSFAATHAKALARSRDVKLTAVFDSNAHTAKRFAKYWRAHACRTLRECLRQAPDIIILATPNRTHARLIENIVRSPYAPRLLIVEKPLCVNRKELRRIEQLSTRTKTHIVVEHSRRFNASFERVAEMIASGKLGQVRSVHFRYYAGWLHIGSHAVDTLRMLIGNLRVRSTKRTGRGRYSGDPLLRVTLASKRYPRAVILLEGMPEDPYAVFEAEIWLSRGRIRLQWNDIAIDRTTSGGLHHPLLPLDEQFTATPIEEALGNLYALSGKLLKRGDRKLLKIAGLAAARGTMDVLFSASERAARPKNTTGR